MYDPTVPALDQATIEAEDRLLDAVEPVLTEWMGARDNLCEELERRVGADWCPPGGVDRALEAFGSARGGRKVRPDGAGTAAGRARARGVTRQGGANRGAPFPPAPKWTPDRAGSVLRGR